MTTLLSEVDEQFRDHVVGKLTLYNGSTQCDVLFEGPCSCGAWHSREELPSRCDRMQKQSLWNRIVTDCYQNGITIPADIESAGTDLRRLSVKEF